MSDYVSVGVICYYEIKSGVDCLAEALGNLGEAQLGNLVEWDSLGRGYAAILFLVERLLVTAVEEERDMGIFLAFGKVELCLSVFRQNLCKGLLDFVRCKGDGQIGVLLVVHRQDDEIQRGDLRSFETLECRISECIGKLYLTLSAAAAEDDSVVWLYCSDGFSFLVQKVQGLEVVVLKALRIFGFDCLGKGLGTSESVVCHIGLLSAFSGQNLLFPGSTLSNSGKLWIMQSG